MHLESQWDTMGPGSAYTQHCRQKNYGQMWNNLMMRQQYLPSEAQKSQEMHQKIARNVAAVEHATKHTSHNILLIVQLCV
jgi:hypothetical protein